MDLLAQRTRELLARAVEYAIASGGGEDVLLAGARLRIAAKAYQAALQEAQRRPPSPLTWDLDTYDS